MDIRGIDYLGLDRVLKRGSGEILASQEEALLIRDTVSGAYMLACEDPAAGVPLLDRHMGPDCRLLMVSNHALGLTACQRYGFSEKLECYQVAYFGPRPPADAGITVRTAEAGDLPMLWENYHRVSPEELEAIVMRKRMLLGYDRDQCVGFVGEHLEGSMGLLYVFPSCRRKGYGAALQRHLMAKTMEEGFIPFGQVAKDNPASLRLQKKIGMTRSDRLTVWMWKDS